MVWTLEGIIKYPDKFVFWNDWALITSKLLLMGIISVSNSVFWKATVPIEIRLFASAKFNEVIFVELNAP